MESQLFLLCTCPICYNPYDAKERLPRLITCNEGHTMCSSCLAIQLNISYPFQCPFDKHIVIVVDTNISRFPINRALLDIVEEGHTNCTTHIDKKLDLICRGCKEQICDRCERKGPHQGHKVSVLEDALDETKKKVEMINNLSKRVQEEISESQRIIDEKEEKLLKEVDNKFEECLVLLMEKREEVHNKVKEHCQGMRDVVESQILANKDPDVERVINWKTSLEKQMGRVKEMVKQPVFFDILDENVEALSKNLEISVKKGKEDVEKTVKDLDQIAVKFGSADLQNNIKNYCEVNGVDKKDKAGDAEEEFCYEWKANWRELDIMSKMDMIEEESFSMFIEKVLETYQFRVESILHLSQDNSPTSPKIPPFYLCSFSCFLASDPECMKLSKWYILDSTLQNSHRKITINELRKQRKLLKILENKIALLGPGYRIDGLALQKAEKSCLGMKINEYTSKSLLINDVNVLLESFMKDNWVNAGCALTQILKVFLGFLIKRTKNSNSPNINLMHTLTRFSRIRQELTVLSWLC